MPNTLRLALLRNEERRLIPDIYSFYDQADTAVKAMVDFLVYRHQQNIREREEFLREQLEQIKEYYKTLRLQYFGEEPPLRGWHVNVEPKTDLSPAQVTWLTYLLIDNAVVK